MKEYKNHQASATAEEVQTSWENLAAAIVEQAIEDYKSCIKWAETGREVIYASEGKLTMEEVYSLYISCRAFFLGDWIEELTAIKGGYILKSLEEQVGIIRPWGMFR